MKLRFSRSSLNLIIFICIILIGWASIDANDKKKRTIDPLAAQTIDLAALSPLKQQTWSSHEGVEVIWQTRLDTDFQIRVRGQRNNGAVSQPFETFLISWQDDYWQWDINLGGDFELGLPKLSQLIHDFPTPLKGQPATIILQGPWSAGIARLTSARLIKSLELKPLALHTKTNTKMNLTNRAAAKIYSCPWQPVSAQYWLQDQLGNSQQSRPDILNKQWWVSPWPKLAPISEQSLRIWKQTFVQQWQLNWQSSATQFDMLADLAYYRLPQNYLLAGYWGINALDATQLETYLAQCLMSEQAEHLGSITHGEEKKQQQ
ncbi:MAG: hypothetical protein ACI9B7_001039 [Oleispira sp.]|jgi:hypothetical protein